MSKKQNSISLSTAEAEFIVARSCYTQLLWMTKLLANYGLDQGMTLFYYDNKSAINILKNPMQHSRTNHIDLKYHFIRDLEEYKTMALDHVTTKKINWLTYSPNLSMEIGLRPFGKPLVYVTLVNGH